MHFQFSEDNQQMQRSLVWQNRINVVNTETAVCSATAAASTLTAAM